MDFIATSPLVTTTSTEVTTASLLVRTACGEVRTASMEVGKACAGVRTTSTEVTTASMKVRTAPNDYSEPEPDAAIVQPDPSFYEDHRPIPGEVFWLIEVSDTTLRFDRETKAPAYARSGILEYWVLDVIGCQLHVYRMPGMEDYQSETILSEELTIAPLAFPDCAIPIKGMLRSREVSRE
jgi:Uma2 family endonuclease